ncbi:hypothetical protein GGR53DRAFT_467189 [Hypoxylon sp. FL1150]|nr:hypothetical protein GGR53DRAFT_467189 [Hypoxylon sp. FL1150]
MEYSSGFPRDPMTPQSPYAQPPGYQLSSYFHAYPQSPGYSPMSTGVDSEYARPSSYQLPVGGHSRVSRESEYRRSHESSRRRAESMLGNVSGPRQSRRGHESSRYPSESMHVHVSGQGLRRRHMDTISGCEEMERTPPEHDRSRSKHRTSGRDADQGRDAQRHGHSHHTSSRPAPMLLEAPSDIKRHSGHRSRHPSPTILVPPPAPMITRLPTPDFDDDNEGFCKHNVSSYEFCACCTTTIDAGGREGARDKMERHCEDLHCARAQFRELKSFRTFGVTKNKVSGLFEGTKA